MSWISIYNGLDGREGCRRLVSFTAFPQNVKQCLTDSVMTPEGVESIPVVIDLMSLGLMKGESESSVFLV
jgi:hypothetical protein